MKTQDKCGDYEIFNRKTKKCTECPKGFIKRASYLRKSSSISKKNKQKLSRKNKNNTNANTNSNLKKSKKSKKKQTYVHEACIKSRGLPGKTSLRYGRDGKPAGIGPLKKGELGRFGYHHLDKLSKEERHKSLKMAVKELGAATIVRKLGAIRTYLKNTSPKVSNIFYEDQRWVRRTYDKDFKGSLENSKLK